MAGRRFLLSHIRRVTVSAILRLLELRQFIFDRRDLRISSFLVVLVARRTDRNRDIGRKSPQCTCPRDVDVTGRALHGVLAGPAFMTEFCRVAFRGKLCHESSGRFVASTAVFAGRFLIFPMTSKAGIMRARHRLEESVRFSRRINGRRQRNGKDLTIRLMTDRAVVVVRFILGRAAEKRGGDQANP